MFATIQRVYADEQPTAVPAVGTANQDDRLLGLPMARLGLILTGFETPGGAQGQAPEVLPPPAGQWNNGPAPLVPPGTAGGPIKWGLDETIKQVLWADPKLRAGMQNIRESEADLKQSSLYPNPTLSWDYLFLPIGGGFTPARPGGPPQQDLWVGYPLDWFVFGKRAAAIASAIEDVHTSEFEFADLVRQRVTSAALAFYDVLEAKALINLARQDVENLTQVEKALAKAVKDGARPAVDLYRVQLDLLKSQQVLRESQSLAVVNLAKLRAFLGPAAGTLHEVEGNLYASVTDVPLGVEDAYNLAVQNRPDIQSLESKIAKAEADVRVENRNAFPDLAAKFGYTRQLQADIGAPNVDSWNVEVDMSLPIFNRNQGKRLKAQAVVVENNYNLQTGLLDLRAEVEQTVSELHVAYQNAQAVGQEQLALAKQVRDSIQKAYQAGARPLIDLLDAERNYRDTYRLYINTRANYWRAVHRFNSALGKQVLK